MTKEMCSRAKFRSQADAVKMGCSEPSSTDEPVSGMPPGTPTSKFPKGLFVLIAAAVIIVMVYKS